MPTIIDSLIVELSLDSKKFNEGQKSAISALRKLEEGAGKHMKGAEKHTDSLTQGMALLQNRLLSVASLFMGGMGISSFAQHITRLTSQTGYLATSLGVSTKELGKWQSMGAAVGASAQEMAAGFAAIQKNLVAGQVSGGTPLHTFSYMTHQTGQGPAVPLVGKDGARRSVTDVLMDMSKWAEAQSDKGVAGHILTEVAGLNQAVANLVLQGPKELEKHLKDYEKYAPNSEQVKKLQDLQETFGRMTTAAEALGRVLLTKFEPALTKVLEIVTKIVDYLIGKDVSPTKIGEDLDARTNGGFSKSIIGRTWGGLKNWWSGKTGGDTGSSATGGGAAGGGGSSATGGGAAGGGGSSATGGGAAGGGQSYNGTLAEQRRQFAQELENNPGLRDKVMRIMYNEQGTHASGTQAVAESMMNRAIIRGTNLDKEGRWTGENGYYAQGNMGRGALENPRIRGILERSLTNALSGGNVSDYATDNASSWLAEKHKRTGNFLPTADIHGETFFSPDTRIPRHMNKWLAWKEQTQLQEKIRSTFQSPNNSIGILRGGGIGSGASSALLNSYGARGSLATNNSISNNTTSNSSQTHIGEMNVTVPPGSDPAAFGGGIRQELQRYDNVQNSNTGLF